MKRNITYTKGFNMLKKTVSYEDYNGVERTEDFYFNLTKSEIMKLEMGTEGGYAEMLQRISNAKDAPEIMNQFERLLKMAYGERSDDGRRFVKSEAISEAFLQTPAYDTIFMELCTDAEKAAKFINAIVPKDMQQKDSDVVDFARKQLK